MIRLNSSNIDDFKPLKILYWDMSFLIINEGKPVGIKAPTELSVEWLDSIHLYFKGHLDSDLIKDLETPMDPTTDKLADSFMKLGSQCR